MEMHPIRLASRARGRRSMRLWQRARRARSCHRLRQGAKAIPEAIGSFQAIAHMLADLEAQVEAAWSLTLRAAWRVSSGEDALKEITMAKLLASEAHVKATEVGMQVMGGTATTWNLTCKGISAMPVPLPSPPAPHRFNAIRLRPRWASKCNNVCCSDSRSTAAWLGAVRRPRNRDSDPCAGCRRNRVLPATGRPTRLYVGGGASVRVAKIIGSGRMVEMMLTGDLYSAAGAASGCRTTSCRRAKPWKGHRARDRHRQECANSQLPHRPGNPADRRHVGFGRVMDRSIAQAVSMTSEDARTGIDAFFNKRKIEF